MIQKLKATELKFEALNEAKSIAEINQRKIERQYLQLRTDYEDEVRVRVEFEIKINKLYHANVSLTKRVKAFEEAQKEEALESANAQSRIDKLQRELAGLKSVLQHRDVQLEGLTGTVDTMSSAQQ